MPNFYFKSLSLKHYRGFREFHIPKLRRVNLIGGMNGVGKTALLEALFMILDRRDMLLLLRPSLFRNLLPDFSGESQRLFWRGDNTSTIEISAQTKTGHEVMQIKHGIVPAPTVAQLTPASTEQVAPTTPSAIGLTVTATVNGNPDGIVSFLDAPPGIAANVQQQFVSPLPSGVMITPSNRYNLKDLADRYTELVKKGKLNRLLDALKLVQPHLQSLQLLQINGQSVIHGDPGAGVQVPINLMGDGALTITSLVLNLVFATDGIAFIDEFDASVHYSVLAKTWASLGLLARDFNCQLFVSTHSRECIQAASDGLGEVGLANDLNYVRLDRTAEEVKATLYEADELAAALKAEWEIR